MQDLATKEENRALTINEWTIFELRKHSRRKETKHRPEGTQNRRGESFYVKAALDDQYAALNDGAFRAFGEKHYPSLNQVIFGSESDRYSR